VSASGRFAPATGPAGAPLRQLVLGHARFELVQLLRNGEQLLLTAIIPTLLLVLFSQVDVVDLGAGSRVAFLAPGILALAVLSTAFTAQAIGTGFERRYGVLKRLGATPLPRAGLLAGKTLAVLAVEAGQVVLLGAVAVALGWRPVGGWAVVFALVLLLVATAAFSGLALLMAGTLRAEATLAGANLLYLVLLLGGGIVIPLTKFPSGMRSVLGWLPSTALSDGLRAALGAGEVRWSTLGILAIWAVVGAATAGRWFRWE
jgi:ABC-2 type transport system permease protein